MTDVIKGVFGLVAVVAGFIYLPAGIAMVALFAVVCLIDGLLALLCSRAARQSRASPDRESTSRGVSRRG